MKRAEQDVVLLRVLELLRGIDTVFAAASPAYKNRILRAVFPEGFTIHEGEKVRTPCVNQIIAELCGGSPDRYRTHFNALMALFAA